MLFHEASRWRGDVWRIELRVFLEAKALNAKSERQEACLRPVLGLNRVWPRRLQCEKQEMQERDARAKALEGDLWLFGDQKRDLGPSCAM